MYKHEMTIDFLKEAMLFEVEQVTVLPENAFQVTINFHSYKL